MGYLSPEQISGEEELTKKSDVFTMGIIFYELCTFNNPFIGRNKNQGAIVNNILNKVPDSIPQPFS